MLPVVENAGWRLSYFGGRDNIHGKLESFAHSEHDVPEVHARVDEMIASGVTVHGMKLERVNAPFPDALRKRFGRQ